MQKSLELIHSIQEKVEQLNVERDALKKQLDEKNQKIESLEADVLNKKNELASLQDDWKRHQSDDDEQQGSSQQNGYTLSEDEMKAMMAEIDKCITLLKSKNE